MLVRCLQTGNDALLENMRSKICRSDASFVLAAEFHQQHAVTKKCPIKLGSYAIITALPAFGACILDSSLPAASHIHRRTRHEDAVSIVSSCLQSYSQKSNHQYHHQRCACLWLGKE